MIKLAVVAMGFSGGSLIGAVSSPSSSFSLADITQLVIASTGLIAAISAFVIGMSSRHSDPRDKLLEMLLEERKEELANESTEPGPEKRRRRRSKP